MFPLIDRLTRITADSVALSYYILDNIFTNVLTKKINSDVCVTDITDHYPILLFIRSAILH